MAYATHVAEQVRPVDLALSMSPLRAGLLGLAVLFAVPTLLSGVSGLAHGRAAELSVGSLVGAGVGAAAIALVVRFASVLWDPRRFGRRLGAMWLFLAAMMWPSIDRGRAQRLALGGHRGGAVRRDLGVAAGDRPRRRGGPADRRLAPHAELASARPALAAARDPSRCDLAHPVCA